MRIDFLNEQARFGSHRIAARVTWEDSERPTQRLWLENNAEAADDPARADAFVAALMPLALSGGERRLLVEGRVCTQLRDNLHAAALLMVHWYGLGGACRIEATEGFAPRWPRTQRRTASFMSGGVDALALLRGNRLHYPADHPASISDCLLVFGLNSFDMDGDEPRGDRLAAFDDHVGRMSSLGQIAAFDLHPVWTNIRSMYPDFMSWGRFGLGSGICFTALAMPGSFTDVWLASNGREPASPFGSHQLLDHFFSSAAVRVHHGQAELKRLDKVRMLAAWPEALDFVRSCFYLQVPPNGAVNCGECEKCVRTMLAFLAAGALHRVSTFPGRDVTRAMLERVTVELDIVAEMHQELVEPLRACGREDLAFLIEAKLESAQRSRSRGRLRRGTEAVSRLASRVARGRPGREGAP
jgi:hypothetical protein